MVTIPLNTASTEKPSFQKQGTSLSMTNLPADLLGEKSSGFRYGNWVQAWFTHLEPISLLVVS